MIKSFCCDKEARWVDNGPRLQYYYCDVCRKEVMPVQAVELIPIDDVELDYPYSLMLGVPMPAHDFDMRTGCCAWCGSANPTTICKPRP